MSDVGIRVSDVGYLGVGISGIWVSEWPRISIMALALIFVRLPLLRDVASYILAQDYIYWSRLGIEWAMPGTAWVHPPCTPAADGARYHARSRDH